MGQKTPIYPRLGVFCVFCVFLNFEKLTFYYSLIHCVIFTKFFPFFYLTFFYFWFIIFA